MATLTTPKPRLEADKVYQAFDRFVCGTSSCAGYTAVSTGRTTGGYRVDVISPLDVSEWPKDLGPLTCECGRLTAVIRKGALAFEAAR